MKDEQQRMAELTVVATTAAYPGSDLMLLLTRERDGDWIAEAMAAGHEPVITIRHAERAKALDGLEGALHALAAPQRRRQRLAWWTRWLP